MTKRQKFKLNIDKRKMRFLEWCVKPLKSETNSSQRLVNGFITFVIMFVAIKACFSAASRVLTFAFHGSVIMGLLISVVLIYALVKVFNYLRHYHTISILNHVVILKSGKVGRLYEFIDLNETFKENFTSIYQKATNRQKVVFKFLENDVDFMGRDAAFKEMSENDKYKIAYGYVSASKQSHEQLNKVLDTINELKKANDIDSAKKQVQQNAARAKNQHRYYQFANKKRDTIFDDLKREQERFKQ